ncbi:PlxyGVORF25-like protein [Hyphantria cunea granulovirus]|uniref:PlxyGVORF25-like protein n=1 Tax=Hyphantria cunea granulovirus TaxID=307448 RepID=A0AAE6D0F9_9BBAC|nr:PlxyGVORF25-like protein [Hyphantria cunea granulovirus]QBQ01578.1 PlxyGVORF25-like protein [Hyphantria cunea granulovirus]
MSSLQFAEHETTRSDPLFYSNSPLEAANSEHNDDDNLNDDEINMSDIEIRPLPSPSPPPLLLSPQLPITPRVSSTASTKKKNGSSGITIDCIIETLNVVSESDDIDYIKTKLEHLKRLCANRSVIRKRNLNRNKNGALLKSYVHIYCGHYSNLKVIGFYNNSHKQPQKIKDLLPVFTIDAGLKSEKNATKIVAHLKTAADAYLYTKRGLHKKHQLIHKNKLIPCFRLLKRYCTTTGLNVLYDNSSDAETFAKEMPDSDVDTNVDTNV